MSYKIEGTKIILTRGDTFQAQVTIKKADGTVYTPEEGDVVRFAVKSAKMTQGNKDYYDKEPLILKEIPTDTMTLSLEPNDTKPLAFGDYKYDMQITYANEDVCTFITDADLTITPEVH